MGTKTVYFLQEYDTQRGLVDGMYRYSPMFSSEELAKQAKDTVKAPTLALVEAMLNDEGVLSRKVILEILE